MLHRTEKIEIAMFAVVIIAAVVSAIKPHSFAVWMTEIFWVAGLMVILLVTRRIFRFSLAAYSCFFAWMMLQTVGAHYTFELVPMDWLKEPLGLARNPYDRIAHLQSAGSPFRSPSCSCARAGSGLRHLPRSLPL